MSMEQTTRKELYERWLAAKAAGDIEAQKTILAEWLELDISIYNHWEKSQ